MKSLLTQAINDWTRNRALFILEMLAMLAVTVFAVVFTMTAGNPNVEINIFLLIVDTIGCSCGVAAAIYRKSVNIFLLNVVIIMFSIAGLLRIYFH